ncbi:hypothetical protein MAPG_07557, partial [Magnaporthiopsis poae ATCC 64411]
MASMMMADMTPSASLPLAPSPVGALNASTRPAAATRTPPEMHEVTASITQVMEGTPEPEVAGDVPASPYLDAANKGHEQQENISPSRGRTGSGRASRPISRIISGGELSPLKILQDRPAPVAEEAGSATATANAAAALSDAAKMPPPNLIRSPRKSSWPDSTKRFPVKVNTPVVAAAAGPTSPRVKPPVHPKPPALVAHMRQLSLEDEAARNNEGLKKAMALLDDEVSGLAGSDDDEDVTLGLSESSSALGINGSGGRSAGGRESLAAADDTMMSTFSNFSAVPTPRANRASMPPPQRTPRSSTMGPGADSGNNTTNLLLEFTEQLRFSHAQQQQQQQQQQSRANMSPSRTTPNLGGAVAATPQRKTMMNLLDFDIPPMPTPRSIPTITPRELESLKSNFLSEISSLKASLSGKEAEAQSLKTAVGDAEKRVGTCMEQLREETTAREQAQSERDDWERRAREMEAVLRKVKEEIVVGQRERDELEAKLEESNMRREMAETMAQEAESKLAAMRAGKAAEAAMQGGEKRSASPGSQNGEHAGSGGKALTPRDVEMAVEKVARELHALYKSKHTDKITALKRSYERRWEKKVH